MWIHDLALDYVSKSEKIASEVNVKTLIIASHLTLSEVYLKLKRYADCEETALKVWSVDSTSLGEAPYAALNLAISNIYMGNKQRAEYFVRKFQDIIYKGNDKQMNELLANMEVKYETEKKEMCITSLEKERYLYVWLGVVSLMLALALGLALWFKIRNSKKRDS